MNSSNSMVMASATKASKESVQTKKVSNRNLSRKSYGYRKLTFTSSSTCKPLAKIIKSPQSKAGHPKVKKGVDGKVVKMALKLDGYEGKGAEVNFVLLADNSYEVKISYPNGASMVAACCKYPFSEQSEFIECAEALDSMYKAIVASKKENVKDVFIEEFKVGEKAN